MLLGFILLGACAGLIAGLLGVGGGLIIVPVLVVIFQMEDFPSSVLVHMAIGTSLASIVFTSISSIWAHNKKRSVLWQTFIRLAPGILAGASFGAVIADSLATDTLRVIFGIFELFVAVQMTLNIKPKPQRTLPGSWSLAAAGNGIGAISSIVGIGGGTLTVPFLTWCNVSMREAIATSAACGLPIAVAGCIGFIMTGWNETGLPQHSLGYVYLPALFGIVTSGVLFAPLGARLAHSLPVKQLKQVFAILLYILAARMLLPW